MRVLVTGGAGFIGSHLVDALMPRGYTVTVLDDLSEGSLANLKPHLEDPKFSFIKGDIRDKGIVKEAVAGTDAVIHEAAMKSIPLSIKMPELAHEVNVHGTINLLREGRDAGIKKFVLASSCAVYGDAAEMPISERALTQPLSPYAKSKLDAEESCREFYLRDGLQTVALRYFNVYGPRQSGGEYAGVMLKFMENLQNGKAPVIYGDGEQTRDLIHVSDVAEATILALERDGIGGEVINVGTMRRVSMNELCNVFINLSGKTYLKPLYEPARQGDIKHSQADIYKAERLLRFWPKVTIERGVEMLWKSSGG